LSLNVDDQDNQKVVVNALDLPQGAFFDNTNMDFIWSPQKNDIGNHKVSFYAIDEDGATGSLEVNIQVKNPVDINFLEFDESLIIGKEYNFYWESAESLDRIILEISRDAGLTWNAIKTFTNELPTNYSWDVTGPASENCKFRIVYSIGPLTFSEETTKPFIIEDQYKYGEVSLLEAGGEQLKLFIPQNKTYSMKIDVAEGQSISKIIYKYTVLNEEDYYELTITSPDKKTINIFTPVGLRC